MITLKQFVMLRFMARNYWSVEQAILFRQRTFGSLCKHKWVDWDVRKKAFYVTRAGQAAWREAAEQNRLYRMDTGSLQWSDAVRQVMRPWQVQKVIPMRRKVA